MLLPLRPCSRAGVLSFRIKNIQARFSSTSTATAAKKQHEPLRILFCGADTFSNYSLRALHEFQQRNPAKIESIDVVCRSDKRVGRGNKILQEVPIKPLALSLSLPLHQLDTFTSWTPPNPPNLIITVSFGLLVPPRILNPATYGGLNVHPSLLPDLRGPAPLQHALLRRRAHTGVSLQTMHPAKFDHGVVLAQSEQPGMLIGKDATVSGLVESLGQAGAEMLVRGIEEGVFVPPLRNVRETLPEPEDLAHAPKISSQDREIEWANWSSSEVLLRDRVLGRLWKAAGKVGLAGTGASLDLPRAVFTGPWTVEALPGVAAGGEPGSLFMWTDVKSGEKRVGFALSDGRVVAPAGITFDGGKKEQGGRYLIELFRKHAVDGVQ